MTRTELVVEIIADLDAIDFYDRVMFNAGICNAEVLNNMLVQDTLLQRLERLDADAYLAYICNEEEVLDKYYRKPKEVA